MTEHMDNAVSYWLSPGGQAYQCDEHIAWAAREVLHWPPASKRILQEMDRRGWMRVSLDHDQPVLRVEARRTTALQWAWVWEHAGQRVVMEGEDVVLDPDDPSRYVGQLASESDVATLRAMLKAQGYDDVAEDNEEHIYEKVVGSMYIRVFLAKNQLESEWNLAVELKPTKHGQSLGVVYPVLFRLSAVLRETEAIARTSLDPRMTTRAMKQAMEGVRQRYMGESLDPDDPAAYVNRLGQSFVHWLRLYGFKPRGEADAVTEQFELEGYYRDMPRTVRVIHFLEGVDYAGKPRQDWLVRYEGADVQREGDESTVWKDVAEYMQQFTPRRLGESADVDDPYSTLRPVVDSLTPGAACVETLLTEADPDEFDAGAYVRQVADIDEMFAALGFHQSKLGSMTERNVKTYLFDEPVMMNWGSEDRPRRVSVEGFNLYDFPQDRVKYSVGHPIENVSMAMGWSVGGKNSPSISLDVDVTPIAPALARVIHSIDQFMSSFSTKGKDEQQVKEALFQALYKARSAQRSVREGEEDVDVRAYIDALPAFRYHVFDVWAELPSDAIESIYPYEKNPANDKEPVMGWTESYITTWLEKLEA